MFTSSMMSMLTALTLISSGATTGHDFPAIDTPSLSGSSAHGTCTNSTLTPSCAASNSLILLSIQWNLLSWSSGQRGPSHTVIVPVQVSPLPFVVLSLLLQAANKPITITPVRKRLSHLFISLPPYVTLFDKHPLPSTYHLFVLLSSPLSILIPLHLFHYKAIFPMMTEE